MRHVLGSGSYPSGTLLAQRARTPKTAPGTIRFNICTHFKVAASSKRSVKRLDETAGAQSTFTLYLPTSRGKVIRAIRAVKVPKSRTRGRDPRVHNHSYRKMKSHIQFITTPTVDTPGTALLLHFDDKRYLIGNIHEGLQRAGLQTGTKFVKVKDFFITGKTEWRSIGGLMGMILTMADASTASAAARAETVRMKAERRKAREEEERQRKTPSRKASSSSLKKSATHKDLEAMEVDPTVRLHGGPNLKHTIATARSFIFRKGTPIKVNEYHQEKRDVLDQEWEPTWADERIRVWAMPIASPNSTHAQDISRKRSLDDSMEGEPPASTDVTEQWSIQSAAPEDELGKSEQLRDLVVSEMFSSEWRYDALIEQPLHDVKLPATLFIRNSATNKIERYAGPLPGGITAVPNINVLARQPWPGALIDHLPPTRCSSLAMSYIIRNHKVRGKFKPAAAKELKVPPGPLWAALAAGSHVQSVDGKTITPDMVLEPEKEGGGFAVVDLPSKDYVASLVNRPEWTAEEVIKGVGAIVWILGPGVAGDEMLSAFIRDRPQLKHVISSTDVCPNYLSMTSAASAAIRHNLIDRAHHPIPVHNNEAPLQAEPLSLLDEAGKSVLLAKRGLKLELEPSFEVTESGIVPHLNTALVIQETPQEVLELGRAAQEKVLSDTVEQDLPSQDAEIICLGTGSALPSPHRNVSATLLRVPGCGSYLLDCGENTLGQLKRVYTESQLAEVLQDLKLIFISHLHADHHLGTASVIKAWYEEVHGNSPARRAHSSLTEALAAPGEFLKEGKRLFVVGHRYMSRWLEEYSGVEDYGYNHIVPLESSDTDWRDPDECPLKWNGLDVGFNSKYPLVKSAIRQATGLSGLATTSVKHCYGAQAISLTFPTGFKFSYSGDCRPSKQFALMGKGSTVLLHEATFDDELQGDALAKRHSTTSEAVGVGAAMGARRLLLTHFSQRYQKLPSMSSMVPGVELESAEDDQSITAGVEDPIQDADLPVENQASSSSVQGGEVALDPPNKQKVESHPLPTSTPLPTASSTEPPPNSLSTDMKIGVAFDYMRVKVRDIIHLEKFNPAMRELYKDAEEDTKTMKIAAREAFSDDENVVGDGTKQAEKRKTTEQAERAEKARQGQKKKAKREREMMEKEKDKGSMDNREKGAEAGIESLASENGGERERAVQ